MARNAKKVNTKCDGGTKAKADSHHIPTADPANVSGWRSSSIRNTVAQSRSPRFFCPAGVSQKSRIIGDSSAAQMDAMAPRPYTTDSVMSQSSPRTIVLVIVQRFAGFDDVQNGKSSWTKMPFEFGFCLLFSKNKQYARMKFLRINCRTRRLLL